MKNEVYNENQLVKVAKRDNNKKRPFLLVNPLQGKHMPVSPTKSLEVFSLLADKLSVHYPNEKLCIIGFAETATAIGAGIAINCPSCVYYIHTTRENIYGSDYLYFSEVHSHATEQKLVKDNLKTIFHECDRIVFTEDEVTTGNTILNLINTITNEYSECSLKFGIISILNAMPESNVTIFEEKGIECIYLCKIDADNYAQKINDYTTCEENMLRFDNSSSIHNGYNTITLDGYLNPRKGVLTNEYLECCEKLSNTVLDMLFSECGDITDKSVLILGTEEFMFPAMLCGKTLEDKGCKNVLFHADTRSPILPSNDEGYPLYMRCEHKSLYDDERTVFIYNLKKYDKVIIMHDSPLSYHAESLISALESVECGDITIINWRA